MCAHQKGGPSHARGNSLKLTSVPSHLRWPRALCWDPGLWSQGRGVATAQATALSSSPGLTSSPGSPLGLCFKCYSFLPNNDRTLGFQLTEQLNFFSC